MDFLEWLESLPGGATPTTAAKKAGLASPTLLRHAERGWTTADNVIAISRAYGVPPVDALVTLGFLDASEAGGDAVRLKEALEQASISQLWDTMAAKIDGLHLTVGKFPRMDDIAISVADDDLKARREAGVERQFKGANWRDNPKPESHVADSSPREPGPGDDGYHDGP